MRVANRTLFEPQPNLNLLDPLNPSVRDDAMMLCLNLRIKSPVGKKPAKCTDCLLYTSPSPRDRQKSRMPSSA